MLQAICDGVKVLEYPFRLAGTAIGRRCTLLALADGRQLLHTTGPFTEEDTEAVRRTGPLAAVVEGTCFHDTFAVHAAAFEEAPYHVPPGMRLPESVSGRALPLPELPPVILAEIPFLRLEGMPSVNEHVFLHKASRTLVVCDLLFNLGAGVDWWTKLFFKHFNKAYGRPAMSRIFRRSIRDRNAFSRSVDEILGWDFDRIVIGHGQIVETGGKDALRQASLWLVREAATHDPLGPVSPSV